MEHQADVLNILCMAVTVDGSIHAKEIETVKKLFSDSFPGTDKEHLNFVLASLDKRSPSDITKDYETSVENLAGLSQEEKLAVIKMVMKVVDADKVMHSTEQRLLSTLMDKWNIEV